MYGNDALLLSGKFGFALKKGYRGMNQVVGFPKRMTDKIIRQVLFLKYNAALITESVQGRYIKDRYVKELYLGITNKSS